MATPYKAIKLAEYIKATPGMSHGGFVYALGYEPESYDTDRIITLGDIAMSSDGSGALRQGDAFPEIEPSDLLKALIPMIRRASKYCLYPDLLRDKLLSLERHFSEGTEYNSNGYGMSEKGGWAECALFNAMQNFDSVVSRALGGLPSRHLGLLCFRAAQGAHSAISLAQSTTADGKEDEALELYYSFEERRRQTADVVAVFGTTQDWLTAKPVNFEESNLSATHDIRFRPSWPKLSERIFRRDNHLRYFPVACRRTKDID